MASTSRASGGVHIQGRIRQATSSIQNENQSLLIELRKGFTLLKDIAVTMEREHKSQEVKKIEDEIVDLLKAYEDCQCFSSAIKTIGDTYQPRPEELTNFGDLFDVEIAKQKANLSSFPENLLRQFRQAIWDVHHHGQPMPGEEQEDVVMTSTQNNILNISCPLSGKPVIELAAPVRGVDCKHIYEQNAIVAYIRSKKGHAKCPISGCPKVLRLDNVSADPMLACDIEELRSLSIHQHVETDIIEDFTELDKEGGD